MCVNVFVSVASVELDWLIFVVFDSHTWFITRVADAGRVWCNGIPARFTGLNGRKHVRTYTGHVHLTALETIVDYRRLPNGTAVGRSCSCILLPAGGLSALQSWVRAEAYYDTPGSDAVQLFGRANAPPPPLRFTGNDNEH